jgi:ketosteroid isomerase-like protein
MTDLEAHVERLETERALTRLVYDYCHGIDRRDLERFLSVWDENATWDTGGPFGSYTGLVDIERGLKESMWPVFSALHHWTVNLVLDVEVGADAATGMSNLTFQGSAPDGTAIVVAATYHDEFSRQSGRWRISRRAIEIHHFAPLPGVAFSSIAGG